MALALVFILNNRYLAWFSNDSRDIVIFTPYNIEQYEMNINLLFCEEKHKHRRSMYMQQWKPNSKELDRLSELLYL